ncbi:DUF3152 domain-containing protein [Dactylosporangium sp. NBC_01737]|uniref:DUF3152 domain-containing protein n=1 Tax=Dactylosporangium sp. NBC_01737 TaxID=2975959 RepID=UPI002E0D1209|nr:DUF3152 domain-containing protein [Dactylosporangium sp. NBC_01737]
MRIFRIVVLLALVAGCSSTPSYSAPAVSPAVSPVVSSAPAPTRGPATVDVPVIRYPVEGGGQFDFAQAAGPVVGGKGTLLSYRVGVERGITGVDAATFGDAVELIYADTRSWPATGNWRLRRAGQGERFDYTIYLATPATRDVLCGNGYDRYTSCRNGNTVVVNVARWARGIPGYGADLTAYRQYVVNHETGHRLGRGHELCPGPGRPAPVMQQQTLGLHGCVANPWPIVDGRPYAGRSGQYNDPTPEESP